MTTMKLGQALDINHIVSSSFIGFVSSIFAFAGKSMMATPQQPRKGWTPGEDTKLIDFKLKYPDHPMRGTAMLAGLNDRTDKSCWERYYNQLKPGISKAKFSQEEDDDIIFYQDFYGNKWAVIRDNHLQWRTANDIKNRYNNHLKKKKQLATSTHQNIPEPQLFHPNQNLPNASWIPEPISASQEIVNPGFTSEEDDELHTLIAGLGPNVNPNETNFFSLN